MADQWVSSTRGVDTRERALSLAVAFASADPSTTDRDVVAAAERFRLFLEGSSG